MKFIGQLLFFSFYSWASACFSQELLLEDTVVQITLENNLDIKVSKNNVEISRNNAAFLNSGFLPTVSTTGGIIKNITDSENVFSDGRVTNLTSAETIRNNAAINVNYTLFNGFGRVYNYQKFKEQKGLTDLQTQNVISQTLLQLFTVYYEVARLSENVINQEKTLETSKKRWLRLKYLFDYGQRTGLDLLNAEVDVNNDTINLIDMRQLLKTTKRDLNIVMNRDIHEDYVVDTTVVFLDKAILEDIYQNAVNTNYEIQQLERQEQISKLDYKLTKSIFLPTIGLTGNYGWNHNKNNAASFLAENTSLGLTGGANLTWNIFGGGKAITAAKNAKLSLQNQKLQTKQSTNKIKKNIENSWGIYFNRLVVYKAQKKNVETNRNNFLRTKEKYKLGQVTNIEFRRAQENLLLSINSKNKAKYSAKIAELQLLHVSGKLIDNL